MTVRLLPLVVLVSMVLAQACRPAAPEPPILRREADVFLRPDVEIIEGRVPPRATLAGLLSPHFPDDVVEAMVGATRTAFDPRRLRADQAYRIERTLDGLLRRFVYEIDADRFLRIVSLKSEGREPTLRADVQPFEKQREASTVEGMIDEETPSLFAAMDRAGEGPDLSMALADIFGGELDFNSDLQRGDAFRIVVEKFARDNRFAGYGAILAAELNNEGRRLRAVRFAPPGGKPGYYDEQGRSLRRMFLQTPLQLRPQISSRFSYRRVHPIHRSVRPHLGVDYRAPAGAGVVAVASGVVTFAADSGASGLMVRVRHARGYESFYLHLSSIGQGMRPGARVAQGQQIGRVGSTGTATGPHLDYRLRRNGVFVNPLRVNANLPPGEPVPAEHRALFTSVRDEALARLSPSVVRQAAGGDVERH